jgi:hypothetical protein
MVIDVKFSGGTDGARQPGRLAKTVGLDKGRTYTLEYFIGSNNKGVMATDDALKQATNDGLWPLKLASAEVRKTDTWRYKYSVLNGSVRETLTNYQTGVLDTVEVPLNNAFGTNMAWVKWGNGLNDPVEGLNDLNVNRSLATTGRGKYGLTTPRTLTEGTVWFHLEYVPFAVFDDREWREVSGNRLTERPVWVIRNGLNDAKQEAATWTVGMAYTGTNGGIAIGVVDPAAPRPVGLYEDNNPWPVPGTEGKTSVEIRDWLTASPITSTKTLAGIKGEGQGKYGSYTLLPRRYYAAPLSGKQAAGGLTGTAANGGASWQDASSDIQKLVTLAAANVALAALPVDIWAAAGSYTNAGGTGPVIDISGGTDNLRIYGGFKGIETAAIGSLPSGRDGWFNAYTTLAIGNRYGTVKDATRETILDAVNVGTAVLVDGAASILLDGFTITGAPQSGLVILNALDTTLFTNLNVTGNSGTEGYPYSGNVGGGGICVFAGAPRLENITVDGNTVTADWGGGMILREGNSAQIKNARFSNNSTGYGQGGGITIRGTPRLENIVVTGNVAKTRGGGGIYIDSGDPVIVNAIVSGNSADAQTTTLVVGGGGGIYIYRGNPVIVNALVSGNRSIGGGGVTSGGGGIKITGNSPRFINVTLSGNYSNTWGGGIFRPTGAGTLGDPIWFYNTVVLGNYSADMVYADDDVWVGSTIAGYENPTNLLYHKATDGWRGFVFNNSILGGRAVSGGKHTDWDPVSPVFPGTGNVSGVGLGLPSTPGNGYNSATAEAGADALVPALNNVFVKFAARPMADNTGHDKYVAGNWDFHLKNPPAGVVDGGSAAHYGLVSGGVSTDVAGDSRTQGGAPDMGAYESTLIGVPVPTYTVSNLKPQSASAANYGYLTVSSAVAQAGAEVTVTATANSGYAVGTITCRTAGGVPVPVTTNGNIGKFTMPAENVTVDATFVYGVSGGVVGGGVNWGTP